MILPFFRKIKITYGITVCNEAMELDRLLKELIRYTDPKDEIIVLRDVTAPSTEVDDVLKVYKENIAAIIERKLNNDFSSFKNNLVLAATGDYLFQIDADEIPQETLIKKIKPFLKVKYKYDCFSIPRINTVDGITAEYLKKWNWSMNEKNYINYPDYQMRIFKLRKGIHWVNKVHEVLTGYKKLKLLKADHFDFCLLHHKKIEKQIRQNKFYDAL